MKSKLATLGLALALPTTPVAVALAADTDAPADQAPATGALAAPIAGNLTTAGEFREAAAHFKVVRERAARRAAARRAARKRAAERRALAAVPAHLKAIAQCESGGDPRAIGGGGTYRGLLQFSMSTWQSVGGQGDPINASVAEQYKRGAILYARSGAGQWPVCGR